MTASPNHIATSRDARLRSRRARALIWGIVAIVSCGLAQGTAPEPTTPATTSPLQVLRAAPRVRLGAPPVASPTPAQVEEAPELSPPQDNSASERRRPATDSSSRSEPKREGLLRGTIRAIPFVGPRIAGPRPERREDDLSPVSTPVVQSEQDSQGVRGELLPSESPNDVNATDTRDATTPPSRVAPPSSDSATGVINSETKTPSSDDAIRPSPSAPPPPKLFPMPGSEVTETSPVATLDAAPPVAPAVTPTPATATPGPSSPVTPLGPSVRPVATRAPEPTPIRADASIRVNPETTPAAVAPKPTKAPSLSTVDADVALGLANTVTVTSRSVASDDLAVPDPMLEPDEAARNEFIAAVFLARAGNYARASEFFRDFETKNPTSQLAPRALFLAALMDPDPSSAAGHERSLREGHPNSPYVAELQARIERTRAATERNRRAALESEIANWEEQLPTVSGDSATRLRQNLARAYLETQQTAAARRTITALLTATEGTLQHALSLDLSAECALAESKPEIARDTLIDLLAKFPDYPGRARVYLNLGLAHEALSEIEKARAQYRIIINQAPASAEGKVARERLQDLDRIAQ